jgi:hypothetical protein
VVITFIVQSCHSAPASLNESVVKSDSLCYPIALEKAVLAVYPAFKELHANKILIRFDDGTGDAFMQAQPVFSDIFSSKKKREYIINVKPIFNTGADSILVHELPDTVLQGWLAHEMGHLMDYRERTGFELIIFGIQYSLFDDYVASVEKAADVYAIQAGFADHIIATKEFILKDGVFPEWYLEKIEDFYLSPDDVREIVKTQNYKKEPVSK